MHGYRCTCVSRISGISGLLLRSALLLAALTGMLTAQPQGSADAHALRMASDPQYRSQMDAIEAWIYREMQSGQLVSARGLLAVPVVVHVMHEPSDVLPETETSNPPDARILLGLEWLNDAFRNRGHFAGNPQFSDAGIPAADIEIEFCLAQTDPQGYPASGITRTPTPLSNVQFNAPCDEGNGLTQDLCLKNLSRWDPTRYLNIWLVNSICDADGDCAPNAYAYMAGAHGQLYDGIVIEAGLWGSSPALMPQVAHEFGHYFNLFDTHGPGDACDNDNCLLSGDRICDTPPDSEPGTVACVQDHPMNTCKSDTADASPNNPFRRDVQDLYENIMDGGQQSCRRSFTPGQKFRMRLALLTGRASLLRSPACTISWEDVALRRFTSPQDLHCGNALAPAFTVANTGTAPVSEMSFFVEVDGVAYPTASWSGLLEPGDSVSVPLPGLTLSAGAHYLLVSLLGVNGGVQDEILSDNTLFREFVTTVTAEIQDFPYCVDFEDGQTAGWTQGNMDQQLGFDLMQSYSGCGDQGSRVLRYNSAGQWNNGSGAGASPSGARDVLVSPMLDFTRFTSAWAKFDVAYAMGPAEHPMRLRISVSDACGGGLLAVYERGPSDLATMTPPAGANLAAWKPDACGQWRRDSVNLDEFAGRRIHVAFEVLVDSVYAPNLYLDNICFDGIGACSGTLGLPAAAGVYTANRICSDDEGWLHYWKTADAAPQTASDMLLFSVRGLRAQGGRLRPAGVKMVITSRYGQGGHDLSQTAPYARNFNGWHTAGRYLVLTPDAQPQGPVAVRYYFDETDWSDLRQSMANASTAAPENLVVYTVSAGVNPAPDSGHAQVEDTQYYEYLPGPQPSLYEHRITSDAAGRYTAEFLAGQLRSGGIGTGGDGLGSGARYPVPILLEGGQAGDQVRLHWETDLERNALHYELYRADADGRFARVAEVPAGGLAANHFAYSHTDRPALEPDSRYSMAGPIRYRYAVSLVHANGMVVNSDTVEIEFDRNRIFSAYPNPARYLFTIAPALEMPAELTVSIYDSRRTAQIVHTWDHRPGETFSFDLSPLSPGFYFYSIVYRGTQFWGKLIKS
ncbi:MAG: M43 family zinc metalloprotease [Bacteroidia bacterium]|nr:M43 family zinc metalloprotease [Bacteroidia bacterium]